MKTPLLVSAATLALLTGFTATALAEPRGPGPRGERMERMFEEADANDDGKVTQEEIAALRAERFSRMDTDGDGKVTKAELEEAAAARARARADRMFGWLDADGDGAITKTEMANHRAARRLARLDANDDGVIDRDELDAAKDRMSRRGMHRGPRGE